MIEHDNAIPVGKRPSRVPGRPKRATQRTASTPQARAIQFTDSAASRGRVRWFVNCIARAWVCSRSSASHAWASRYSARSLTTGIAVVVPSCGFWPRLACFQPLRRAASTCSWVTTFAVCPVPDRIHLCAAFLLVSVDPEGSLPRRGCAGRRRERVRVRIHRRARIYPACPELAACLT